MKRFLAKLVFHINIGNGKHDSQFDEQMRLIMATNKDDAFFKARNIGKTEEESFLNKDSETVNWKFIDVANLYEIDDVKDGDQLYSSTHESEDANSFIKFIRQKSMLLQVKNLSFA